MSKKYTGHCACGQVTYGFDTEPTFIANCHCTDCKRASGGQMATIALVPDTDFTVFSGNTKSFSYGPNTETCAGKGLDRVFCAHCALQKVYRDVELSTDMKETNSSSSNLIKPTRALIGLTSPLLAEP